MRCAQTFDWYCILEEIKRGSEEQILTVQVGVSAIDLQTLLGGNVAQASVCEQRKAPGKGRVQPTNAVSFQPHVLKHTHTHA